MHQLSQSTIDEIIEYFREQKYSSKSNLCNRTRNQLHQLLLDCEFVYVSESGKVIHCDRYCGTGLYTPVHIEQAIKLGYDHLCSRCAQNYRMEQLIKKYAGVHK